MARLPDVTRPRQGSWPGRLFPIAFAAAMAAAGACGQAPPVSPRPSQPAVTQAPTPAPAPLSEWQKLGATELPPPELQSTSLSGISVVDQTNGAIDEATARAWAEAFLRAINFEYWAVSRRQDAFLTRSGLSSAPLAVFRPDLADIAAAQKANSRIDYSRKVYRRMVLRPVPDALRAQFSAQLVVWKPYAFYLDAVGPSSKRVTDAAGRQTTQTLYQPGQPAFELVGGELVHDRLMGDVFAFASDWDCLDSSNRQKLAPLCNP